MRNIEKLRRALRIEHFTTAEILTVLGPERHHASIISRMVSAGDIVRVRNGLFVFGSSYQEREINLFSVANVLFGPSYVSLESALSYYGMIPEAAKTVTSITWKRTKRFSTPIGNFLYRRITKNAFSEGVSWKTSGEARFLIACPEKATVDKLYLDATTTDSFDYLRDSLRIEPERLRSLSINRVGVLARLYHNERLVARVGALRKALKKK